MTRKRIAVLGLAWSLAALLPLAGCNRGPSKQVQQELTTLRSQRDSLIREEATKTQTMQRLSHALDAIQGTTPTAAALPPESLRDRITALATELNHTHSALVSTRRRMRIYANQSSSLRDSLQTTRAQSDSLLSMQRDSMTALSQSLTATTDSLGQRVAAVSDTLQNLEKEHYTVYYAIGTEQDLLNKGVITKEGGARFLGFLWKRGQTLVPARSLKTSDFTAVDLRTTTDIKLPAQGMYRVLSRQSTQSLSPAPAADGSFTGNDLKITDPQDFWQQSHFLILVREQ